MALWVEKSFIARQRGHLMESLTKRPSASFLPQLVQRMSCVFMVCKLFADGETLIGLACLSTGGGPCLACCVRSLLGDGRGVRCTAANRPSFFSKSLPPHMARQARCR